MPAGLPTGAWMGKSPSVSLRGRTTPRSYLVVVEARQKDSSKICSLSKVGGPALVELTSMSPDGYLDA